MLRNHIPSIKFFGGFAFYLAIALSCSIALRLAAAEVLQRFESSSDRPAIEILNSNQ